jgi:5'-methylthioadenosine phosphorylase
MHFIGIMTGTVTRDVNFFDHLEERLMENEFGQSVVLVSDRVAVIPRHGRDPRKHILPHLINHRSNLKVMKDLGVEEVLAVNSTGSLKRHLKPGMLVVPDDFILLSGGPTIFTAKAVHITPTLSEKVRQKVISAARGCRVDAVDGGIYWETRGPRLETRAEIAMMSRFADLVGMTMASEAIIAKEMDLPYASLCSIDNFGHGLGDRQLTMEEIKIHAGRNAQVIVRIVDKYIEENAS